jgi:hypothetical protein
MESPVSTWTGTESGDRVDDDFFRVLEIDEIDSTFNDSGDLLQNETAYLLIQHDPGIKIDRIAPSTGTVQQSPVKVTRSQGAETVFYTKEEPFALDYIPEKNSVGGFWWIDPPSAIDFDGSGSPQKTVEGREITVDVEGFGDAPCPCTIKYDAEFLQYPWVPPTTDFQDSETKWPVAFQVYFSKV